MDQTSNDNSKRGRGGDQHTPQAKQRTAQREEQIVQLRLRRIPFSAIARTVGIAQSQTPPRDFPILMKLTINAAEPIHVHSESAR
jgi:hypothetical protein